MNRQHDMKKLSISYFSYYTITITSITVSFLENSVTDSNNNMESNK